VSSTPLIVNVSQRSLVTQILRALEYSLVPHIGSIYANATQVMAAFLFTGWLTFGLAAILGYQNMIDDLRVLKLRGPNLRAPDDLELRVQSEVNQRTHAVLGDTSSQSAFQPPVPCPGPLYTLTCTDEATESFFKGLDPRWIEVAKGILAPLCDLQVATGTAILVAGLAQGSRLTYYHELIIQSYWNITLNSFWAAQISNPKYCEINDLPSLVRNVTVLSSVVFSIYFQTRATIHQYRPGYWDPFTPGRCYLLPLDRSGERQAWFWIAGLSMYAIVLVIRMLPIKQDFLEKVSFKYLDNKINQYFTASKDFDIITRDKTNLDSTRGVEQTIFNLRRYRSLRVACQVLAFLVTSFLAVWSYGSGSFGIETVAIFGYLSWNTLDIIDVKVANLHLIDPPESEMSWGFGQVLPMVLLVTILFSALDVFGEVKEEEQDWVLKWRRWGYYPPSKR
jgi:hypothetical protein